MKGFSFLLFGIILLVPVASSGDGKVIYVDRDASGTQDGSWDHPYKTIRKALDHTDEGTEVYVAKGTYKENITIPRDVELYGMTGDRDDVTIEGDSDEPTVEMKHEASISHVTIEGGKYGILVRYDAKAHIYDVKIDDAKRDGIYAHAAQRNKGRRLYIDHVEIRDSGKAGIFSKERMVVIVDSEIHRNNGNGIDFLAGVKGWIEKTHVKDNDKSGLVIISDGSDIWMDKSHFRRNGREGVQIEGYGASGSVGIKRSKAVDNGRYGIAIVSRNAAGSNVWKNYIPDRVEYWGNGFGNVSSVIAAY